MRRFVAFYIRDEYERLLKDAVTDQLVNRPVPEDGDDEVCALELLGDDLHLQAAGPIQQLCAVYKGETSVVIYQLEHGEYSLLPGESLPEGVEFRLGLPTGSNSHMVEAIRAVAWLLD